MFNILPVYIPTRGFNKNQEIIGFNPDYLTVKGDGINVFDYDPNDRIPQLRGVVAIPDRTTGRINIGDKHGVGTFTVVYDDGRVQRSIERKVRFSRVDISLENLPGLFSRSKDEPFITEQTVMDFQVSNPGRNFLGDVPRAIARNWKAVNRFK